MAKLHVRRKKDGKFYLRGIRLSGKSLAHREVRDGVERKDLKRVAQEIMEKTAPPRITPAKI